MKKGKSFEFVSGSMVVFSLVAFVGVWIYFSTPALWGHEIKSIFSLQTQQVALKFVDPKGIPIGDFPVVVKGLAMDQQGYHLVEIKKNTDKTGLVIVFIAWQTGESLDVESGVVGCTLEIGPVPPGNLIATTPTSMTVNNWPECQNQ